MRRVMYCSAATGQWSGSLSNDLARILMQSRRHNHEADVTGVLCFKDGHYLQVLEGPSRSVVNTYRRIESDDRHINVEVLLDEDSDRRLFAGWSMKLSTGFHAELATFLRSSVLRLPKDKAEHADILRKFVPQILVTHSLPSVDQMIAMEVRLSAIPSTAGHCKELRLLDVMGRLIRTWCRYEDLMALSGKSPEELRDWLEPFYRAGHLRIQPASVRLIPRSVHNTLDSFYERFRNALRNVWE